MPEPEVKPLDELLVKPPRKVNAGLFVSVQIPPELIVTAPTNRLVPVALLSFKVPVIEEVPVTVRFWAASCKVPAVLTKLFETASASCKVYVPPPPFCVRL